jgi:alpha-acetolactate decarboxylase
MATPLNEAIWPSNQFLRKESRQMLDTSQVTSAGMSTSDLPAVIHVMMVDGNHEHFISDDVTLYSSSICSSIDRQSAMVSKDYSLARFLSTCWLDL